MKAIVSHQGERKLITLTEPFLSGYDIKIKSHYSCISYGTEQATINNSSLLKHIKKLDSIAFAYHRLKKLGLLGFIKKLVKFNKTKSQIGYSLVGQVIEKGSLTNRNDIKIGDIVVASGEYATHSEFVVVPQGMVTKIDKAHLSKNISLYSLATIAAVPIHGIRTLFLHNSDLSKKKCLIIGGGIIGTFCGLFLKKMGIREIYVHDNSPDTLSNNFFDRCDDSFAPDSIFVCSGSMSGVGEYVERSNFGCEISVIGETQINIDRAVLENKYATMKFCKSYGTGRGEPSYELLCREPHYLPELGIRNNITLAQELLYENSDKILENIQVSSSCNSISNDKINVISWI